MQPVQFHLCFPVFLPASKKYSLHVNQSLNIQTHFSPNGCIKINPLTKKMYFSHTFQKNTIFADSWFLHDEQHGVWRSWLACLLWEQGVAGSNPATPTFENEGVR